MVKIIADLVVIGILVYVYLSNYIAKKRLLQYYDEQINRASVTGDMETAARLIHAKSKVR